MEIVAIANSEVWEGILNEKDPFEQGHSIGRKILSLLKLWPRGLGGEFGVP